jgi:hypothetical protein
MTTEKSIAPCECLQAMFRFDPHGRAYCPKHAMFATIKREGNLIAQRAPFPREEFDPALWGRPRQFRPFIQREES